MMNLKKKRKKVKKYYLSILLLLSLFNGCSDVDQSVEGEKVKIEKPTSPSKINHKEESVLNQLGFELKGEKIIIDMNKTTEFFESLEREMEKRAKAIESKIANAEINMTEGMGIDLEDDSVEIDLNKTKNMFRQINVLMKEILLDVNSSNP